ncbi:MAG: ABC transporter substrate-binding protein [Deltaproteobacteria bacterium]|nr:ABC transporter substrate-binding protein [Deltaproteobacteria bacterium]
MKITVAHSPDADDAFMFYALARGKIDTGGIRFEHTLQDIQKCNEDALKRKFDVTAISFAAYPQAAKDYLLMTSGTSMGEKNYGPLLVAKRSIPLEEVARQSIAIPGRQTTAALLLKRAFPEAKNLKVYPFDQIMKAVLQNEAEIGLIIHEGQLTYAKTGLVEIFNFGWWWWEREKLPLPLGGNVIAKGLEPALRKKINRLLKQSIQYALDHREEALDYALQFARGLDPEVADRFVGMYVNERTLDYGPDGKMAIEKLLGIKPEFVT